MSLWFVTPAWKREELTAVCLDQRLDVIRYLGTHGLEARCVVVAGPAARAPRRYGFRAAAGR